MYFIYIFIVFLEAGYCWASLCGDPPECQCNLETGFTSCLNLPEIFPIFNTTERLNVAHLEIANTQLNELPTFNDTYWPMLRVVVIHSNPRLNICPRPDTLFQLSNLTLLTDCPGLPRHICNISSSEKAIDSFTTACLVTLMLETLGVITLILKNYRKTHLPVQEISEL